MRRKIFTCLAVALVFCFTAALSFAAPFTDNHDGTVTDARTGLMWQQGEPGYMPWQQALDYCEGLTLPTGGYSDWRLPNVKELESITDDTIYDPNDPHAIDRNFFPNAYASNYWSSTSSAYYPGYAWGVYFYYGGVGYGGKVNDDYVRCVRAGQGGGSLGNLVISPPSFDFGRVRVGSCSASQQFMLTNTGSGTLHVSDVVGTDSADFTLIMTGGSSPCNVSNPTLAPAASCTLTTKYCPTSNGSANTFMLVASDDPDNPTVSVAFTGTTSKINGWVVTIDGMDMWSTFLGPFADSSTNYLNEAIDRCDTCTITRDQIELRKGKIVNFDWNGDTAYTDFYVEQLYNYLKGLNSTGKPVVILSHSWGTVLSYIALVNHSDIQVEKLITMGSPLSADDPYILLYTQADAGFGPKAKPDNVKTWHNYYTGCDNIGGRNNALPAIDNYENNKYYPNRLFWNPLACHSSYFDDDRKWNAILLDVIKP